MADLEITSPLFEEGDPIPERCSRDGGDISPPLEIADPPGETESLALIMDDPDAPAGTWVHWLLWNVPGDVREIAQGQVPPGAEEGLNSWGEQGYGGPQPPSGTHHYFFRVYALDTSLQLPASSEREDLEGAMRGHVLDEAVVMGTYSA
jgi:Raf kinase inhibitor-like YbhB/YbcL family protein